MTFARFSLFCAFIFLVAPVAQPAFAQASLQARDTAPAAGALSVVWQGPGGPQDTIYVTAAVPPKVIDLNGSASGQDAVDLRAATSTPG